MAYGEQIREEMKAREAQLRNFFGNVDVGLRRAGGSEGPQKWGEEERALSQALFAATASVHERLLDSIDTRGAMDALSELIKAVNLYLAARADAAASRPQAFLLRQCGAFVSKVLSVFGLAPSSSDSLGMGNDEASITTGNEKVAGVLDAFCNFRDQIRHLARSEAPQKDFLAASDAVRDDAMVELGVRLEDLSDGGSVWKVDDPAVLLEEREAKRRAAAEAAARKLKSKMDALQRDLDKYEKLMALTSASESLADKYSKFDPESGDPTHDAAGAVLEGKALDKARKDIEKARKVRAPLAKRIVEEGADFLDGIRAEIEALRAMLAATTLDANGA